MSKFTDYFPAGGGGGGSTSSNDPSTLDRNIVGNTNLWLNTSTTTEVNVLSNTFWTGLTTTTTNSDPIGSYVLMPSDSTSYQTIVDLSYPGVGGKLFNVIGPALDSPLTLLTFKITIDGTATEIEYQQILSDTRPLLGDFLTGRLLGTPVGGISTSSNSTYSGRGTSPSNRGSFNGFSTMSSSWNNLSLPSTFSGFSNITFEDTCKVEIKVNVAVNQSNSRNRTGVTYLLN
tara:strand:- start:300 stop:992 length:693 start_codon:yes stop_codon:yes gene_type:complete